MGYDNQCLLDDMLEARYNARLTQEKIAEKMGTYPSAISRMEKINYIGNIRLETLRKYAAACGCMLRISLVE